MSMRLQQSGGFNLSTLSVEQLTEMMKNKALAGLVPAIQAELNERTKPKAILTVELLKNSNVKPIGDTGLSRVQGTVVSAKFENPGPQDEMTFGFGSEMGVAQIGIFLQIPDEQLDRLNFSMSTHVTCEVALTINPNGGHFVLAAGTINELRSVYVPERGRNVSLQVWSNDAGEEYIGKQAPAGFNPVKLPSYGNITVLDILEVNTVNLALTNSVIPEDKAAWLKSATAQVKANRELNLNAYLARQSAQRESTNNIVNDALKDAAATIPSKEEDVALEI
jgi:hypothetical protein